MREKRCHSDSILLRSSIQKQIPTVLLLPTFFFFYQKIPTIFANTKRPTYCSVEHRADSHMKKIALRSVCETLICVKEFMQGSLHIGMQVCECGLGDIPF